MLSHIFQRKLEIELYDYMVAGSSLKIIPDNHGLIFRVSGYHSSVKIFSKVVFEKISKIKFNDEDL